MRFYTSLIILSLIIMLGACGKNQLSTQQQITQLTNWMTGHFDSGAQAKADTNFYNIHLNMVPIWNERTDATYLYVEQAAAWALDKPYRQRVYRIAPLPGGKIESAVWSLNNPLRFAGAYKTPRVFNKLTPDSLQEREGCAIILEFKDGVYSGSTVDRKCQSSLRGASYATSEVRIEAGRLTSWDRGWDAEGHQVWGAEIGPYIFVKNSN